MEIKSKLNNLPAFPTLYSSQDDGMTLRDYFAAKAMQVLLHKCVDKGYDPTMDVDMAYNVADAMLIEREKQ